MNYQAIKCELYRVDQELRDGTIDEAEADRRIRSLGGCSPVDIKNNMSVESIGRLVQYERNKSSTAGDDRTTQQGISG